MKKLFDELSYEVSKCATRKYSTSFSLGILALKPSIRPAIYSIYGFVRLADEIVDSFHDYDKQNLLQRFRAETNAAIKEKISLNPILQSFQETVHKFSIEHSLIDQFFHSMEMDLSIHQYDHHLYEEYIFGSAQVVGLMCLRVFCEGGNEMFERLSPFAMKLGSAFQKVNFLRDVRDDFHTLGRNYFPNMNLNSFSNQNKKAIELDVAMEFKEALKGIKMLPRSSRFGVYLAYRYYLSLLKKIEKTPPEQMMMRRVRIPNRKKLTVMMHSYFHYKIAM